MNSASGSHCSCLTEWQAIEVELDDVDRVHAAAPQRMSAARLCEGLQDTQIAEIMQQNAALTCLDGAPATMALLECL
jgi:hypothetical protein